VDSFWVNSFHSLEKPLLYRAYLRLLYDVFVGEQGWDIPSDHMTGELLPSYFDTKALISVARNSWGQVIGGVRASVPGESFPHEHLFTAHLLHPSMNRVKNQISSLNALAVERGYRRSLYSYGSKNQSVAKQLLDDVMAQSIYQGAKVFVCSTGVIEAAKLLRDFGFKVLDNQFFMDSPYNSLINMAFVAEDDGDLITYVNSCEEKALGSLSFENFIQMHLSSARNYKQAKQDLPKFL
jgi:hypothetical protein